MPVHLLHDRKAEQSVFKGQGCFYFSPTPLPNSVVGGFLSVLHPGEDFFFFFIISSQQLGGNKGTQLFSEP